MPSKSSKSRHTMPDKRTVKALDELFISSKEARKMEAKNNKRRQQKSELAWAVFGQYGGPFTWSVSDTRRDAIKHVVENYRKPWELLEGMGYRVRRVEISWEDDGK